MRQIPRRNRQGLQQHRRDQRDRGLPPRHHPAGERCPHPAVGGVSMMLSSHVKEIALGALAAVSLFMVSMMVRKNGGIPVPAGTGGGARGPGGLSLADGPMGSTVDVLLGKAAPGKVFAGLGDVTTEVGE